MLNDIEGKPTYLYPIKFHHKITIFMVIYPIVHGQSPFSADFPPKNDVPRCSAVRSTKGPLAATGTARGTCETTRRRDLMY
jgi:hypothetical protein